MTDSTNNHSPRLSSDAIGVAKKISATRMGVLNPAGPVEDPDRVPDRLGADAIDGDLPRVGRALDVCHGGGLLRGLWSVHCGS